MSMLKARITHKHDTEANWNKAVNFIPLEGELIIYDADNNYDYPRMKVGDGKTTVSALPFADTIVNGEGANSIQQTGTDNNALSENGVAFGAHAYAGCMASYIDAIDTTNKKIYLRDDQKNLATILGTDQDFSKVSKTYNGTFTEKMVSAAGTNFENIIGKYLFIRNAKHYEFLAKVSAANSSECSLTYEGALGFTKFSRGSSILEGLDPDEWTVRIPECPLFGFVALAKEPGYDSAAAIGSGVVAGGAGAFAANVGNISGGHYGFAVNRENMVGYCGFAAGKGNKATCQGSFVEGAGCIAGYDESYETPDKIAENIIADYSHYAFNHAEGENTRATGRGAHSQNRATYARGEASTSMGLGTTALAKNSVVAGWGTVTNNPEQVVIGRYNVYSNTADDRYGNDRLFIVGNGTNGDNRSNAFTVFSNGGARLAGGLTLGAGLYGTGAAFTGAVSTDGNVVAKDIVQGKTVIARKDNTGNGGNLIVDGELITSIVSSNTEIEFKTSGTRAGLLDADGKLTLTGGLSLGAGLYGTGASFSGGISTNSNVVAANITQGSRLTARNGGSSYGAAGDLIVDNDSKIARDLRVGYGVDDTIPEGGRAGNLHVAGAAAIHNGLSVDGNVVASNIAQGGELIARKNDQTNASGNLVVDHNAQIGNHLAAVAGITVGPTGDTKNANNTGYGITAGEGNIGTNDHSITVGLNNHNVGSFNANFGEDNQVNTANHVLTAGKGNRITPNHNGVIALGEGLISGKENQTLLGKYNSVDNDALLVIGNGSNTDNRSNILTVTEDGDIYVNGAQISKQTLVTYDELVTLRDSSQLVPGMFYRITDYECTTTQTNTQAASHKFDIIVQALSESTLSENAHADYHINDDGSADGYFATGGFRLDPSYELLEDETGVSDTGNYHSQDIFIDYGYAENPDGVEVPVLYKTDITTYPNEADYQDIFYYSGTQEVDGTTYDKWRKIDDSELLWDGTQKRYVLTEVIVTDNTFNEALMAQHISRPVPIANLSAWELKYSLDNDETRFAWADIENGTGVIYYMKDEHNNECPYDFKNIKFIRQLDALGSLNPDKGEDIPVYTFTAYDSDNWKYLDMSVIAKCEQIEDSVNFCYNNIIKERYSDSGMGALCLNDIVFINRFSLDNDEYSSCHSNTFGINAFSNTFGDHCYSNTFGIECYDNTFSDYCYSNTFGDYCYSNTFYAYCRFNTFGNDCYNNTFGAGCHSNTFGTYCSMNAFGITSYSNTFGNMCRNNTFGNDCHYNVLDDECENNTFGMNCNSNTLRIFCNNNTFGTGCCTNTFGNGCDNNTFGMGCLDNTFGNGCRNNTFGDDCSSNTFGKDCIYITFGRTEQLNDLEQKVCSNCIEDDCRYLRLVTTDTLSPIPAMYITVKSGIYGANENNWKTLTVARGDMPVIFEAPGTTHIILD